MKRAIFFTSMAVVLLGLSGCRSSCAPRCPSQGGCGRAGAAPAASPTAAVAYPYYTVRGPRDFLDKNPQSIGP